MPSENGQARLLEAERHQRILSEVSRSLLSYVGADEIEPLRRIVESVADALGNWCAFSLVQPDGLLKEVAAFHPDPRQRDLAEKVRQVSAPRRWDDAPEEFNALLAGKALAFEEITDEMLRRGSFSEQHYELLKGLRITSAVVAPMYDGQRPLGTLTLISTGAGGRRYSQSDLDFAFALADRAGLAVRNARLVAQLGHERDQQELARKQLVAVLENDPNGIGIFDPEGRLKYASPILEEYFGVPLRRMIGEPFVEVYRRKFEQVASSDRERLLERIQRIFEDPLGRSSDEIELERPVRRALHRTSVPILGPGGAIEGRLFVYVDVTARKDLDRQRSDFLTVAAHELRTPLTPLSMYLQSMERKLAKGQPIDAELAGKARRQVGRLARLVEDLLDVSRLEAQRLKLAFELLDLRDVAAHVVADFKSTAQRHGLSLALPDQPLTVRGDRMRLEQVLVNLLQNAIKYSPEGGEVTITLETRDQDAFVSVIDRGIGIPQEDQKSLFQRFFRAANAATRNYAGLGIGLYVSHEIVAEHGGRFRVRSEPGKGSEFSFSLPLASAARNVG